MPKMHRETCRSVPNIHVELSIRQQTDHPDMEERNLVLETNRLYRGTLYSTAPLAKTILQYHSLPHELGRE